MLQCPLELRVLERPGKHPSGVEHPAQRDRRDQPPHGAEIHRGRLDPERLEADALPVLGREVDLSLATDASLRPPRGQRIAEHPVHLERERRERSARHRVTAQPPGERQRLEERARELEVEVFRLEVRVPQRGQPRVRGRERSDPAGHGAGPPGQTQRAEPHLQDAPAVRAQPHVPCERGAPRESPVDEVEVPERGGVGTRSEVVQQRVVGPANLPAHPAERRSRKPHARQIDFDRVPDHVQPAGHVHEPQVRIAALHGQAGDVDANPGLAWRRDLQRREARVEVLEPPDPHPPVRPAALDLDRRIARRHVPRLQPQRHGAVLDLHVPKQNQRRWPVGSRVRAAQAEQLLEVEPTGLVLDDVDDRLAQRELEQHHAPRHEVERIVAELRPRQPGDERRVGVEQPHVR